MDKFTHIKIGKGTADEIQSGLADGEAKLAALTSEMHNEFTIQTGAVKSAVDALRAAVSNLTANPSTTTVKDTATALGGVATATSSLLAALAPKCGSASASAGS